ncbi:MAG: hypothetical protein SF051_15200 [Elusimicrobiota bacterium]|nr:hypothetical protein [Elusimicrobiota bacterium]
MTIGFAAGFGACLLGAVGFAAGFFGPIVLNPEANQGPLMGLFITGPAGVVLGGLLGTLLGVLGVSKARGVAVLGAAAASGGAAVLTAALPAPAYRGNLVELEVTDCVLPMSLKDEAFAYWEKRLAAAAWARPRQGWKDAFPSMVAGDPGVVLSVKTLRGVGLYENRKPWNKGTFFAGKLWWPRERYFLRGATCTGQVGRVGVYAPRGEESKDWPAEKLPSFLNLSVLEPATPEQAALLP